MTDTMIDTDTTSVPIDMLYLAPLFQYTIIYTFICLDTQVFSSLQRLSVLPGGRQLPTPDRNNVSPHRTRLLVALAYPRPQPS
jgi:hypothetical protein